MGKDRFSLLPLDIKIYILKLAKEKWKDFNANKIINNWYLYFSKKIISCKKSLNLNRITINYDSEGQYINTIEKQNAKNISYISKYFTGKIEDLIYWNRWIELVTYGLIYYKELIYNIKINNYYYAKYNLLEQKEIYNNYKIINNTIIKMRDIIAKEKYINVNYMPGEIVIAPCVLQLEEIS